MRKTVVKKCCICGKPVFSLKSIYCRTCSHFSARISNDRIPLKVRQDIWDYVRRHGYVCYYTQMELDVFDYKSPWFLEFDHLVPGDPGKVVITSAFFNEMKGDLAIHEFWYYIAQLFNFKTKHTKIKKKNLRYWYRLQK